MSEKIFYNDTLNLSNYNLSYDFFYNNVGIDVQECYPSRCGFYIIDKNKNNYIFIKILYRDLSKYLIIFDILEYLKKNNANILEMYSIDGKKYFFDDVNEQYYIIFKLVNGIYKKWIDFDFNSVIYRLKDFYQSSSDILNNLSNFNLKEDIEILTIGNELKLINRYFLNIENMEKIIFYKQSKSLIDDFFDKNKEYMKNELFEVREFFLSKEYKIYCEDYKNIRFINGNLSNKSFLFNEKDCFIVNFYDSSIDLFAKDIAILIGNGMFHASNEELSLFAKNLLKIFNYNDSFHLEVISNYLKIYNYIFKWFNEYYIQGESCKNIIIEDKVKEIDFYKQKQYSLIKEHL